MAANYADVLDQLRAAGLLVDELQIGRLVRTRVEGDRERRGWYMLHELHTSGGDLLIVGTYGVWHGNDSGTQKIALRKAELSSEQRESLRRRFIEDRRRADQARREENERAAAVANKAWLACAPTGESDYLVKKGVAAHGLRFSPSGVAVVPMLDVAGRIHGLQLIRSNAQAKEHRKPAKEYWPAGLAKKGHFHLIGMPQTVLLVCEGYATGASLHEATGLPVAIAFDAGNLAPVAAALHKRHKRVRILICADDDAFASCTHCKAKVLLAVDPKVCPACAEEHGRINTGVSLASAAAIEVSGAFAFPLFTDEGKRREAFTGQGHKRTDFNDLHAVEGLNAVREQIQGRLAELAWSLIPPRAARNHTTGGEGSDPLRPIESFGELLDRYVLVYGQGGTVFDRQEHCLLALSDMRDACSSRDIHRAWSEHPDRAIVRVREVGFDPACDDPEVLCNLWAGWPTKPRAGRCEKLLELLRYMCSGDSHSEYLYRWVLRWVAFPIQHPGAKMKTTLVLHGPQGTGKNLFFEALMSIYGQYGRVIDQSAIEDRFNDWASRKLFLIADEVVARSDLYHVKNKLKAFITGEWIRINPKNMAAYDERNHVNVVFLSNESMPVVLEEDDRRHAIIWTPEKLSPEFYREVMDELRDGGAAALHDYLLHLDLGDFGNGTLPPATAAKAELINLSLDSTSRFVYDLQQGEIEGVSARPCLATDLYELYKTWCGRSGHRAAPMPKLINVLDRKHKVPSRRKRYQVGSKVVEHPKAVLLFPDVEMPPGEPEVPWLGTQIAQFYTEVKDYKGADRG